MHRGPWMRHGHHGQRSFFKRGGLKFVLLYLLADEPRHGYDLIREIENRSGGFYSPSPGTVYPTLQMLEDQGLVRSREEDGRKVYRITPEGEQYLDEHKDHVKRHHDRVRAWFEEGEGSGGGHGKGWWATEDFDELRSLFKETGENVWRVKDDPEKADAIKDVLRRSAADIKKIVES